MALEHTALYIETADAGRVVELLGPVFAQQCEAVGRPAAELCVVALGGWTAVLGAQVLDGLPIVAEGVSRELGARAAALELLGAAFRYQLVPFRAGARLRAAGFGAPALAAEAPMPPYPDAELEAYRHLLELGVPAPLALLSPAARGQGDRVPSVALRWEHAAWGTEAGEASAVRHTAGEPPVFLARTPDGQVIEPRVLSGRPNVAALRRLLDLEAVYQARARAPVRFAYRHAPGEVEFHVARELAKLTEGERPSWLSNLLKR